MRVLDFRGKRLYLDGAFGSQLIKRGYTTDKAEEMNITHPDVVKGIHSLYVDSGSNVIYTNTFGANSIKNHSQYLLSEIILAAIDNAYTIAKGRALVAYSCGPLGALLEPYGDMSFDSAYELFAEQARIIAGDTRIGYVVTETFTDALEEKAALLAFRDHTDFPIFTSMSFDEYGRTVSGNSVASFALTMQALGASGIGMNCGLGPDKTLSNAREITKYARVPVFVKPNAGIPVFLGGEITYDMGPEKYAAHMREIADTGIGILGGCCGTDEDYILATIRATKDIAVSDFSANADYLTYGTGILSISDIDVGNLYEDDRYVEALANEDYDTIADIGMNMMDDAKNVLAISGEGLGSLVTNIQSLFRAPLCIVTEDREELERALRVYNGIPAVRTVETNRDLVTLYGAIMIK